MRLTTHLSTTGWKSVSVSRLNSVFAGNQADNVGFVAARRHAVDERHGSTAGLASWARYFGRCASRNQSALSSPLDTWVKMSAVSKSP